MARARVAVVTSALVAVAGVTLALVSAAAAATSDLVAEPVAAPTASVLLAEGPIASPSPPPLDTVVPPEGATVPEDAFTEQELAEEGALEPLPATIPSAVHAGGGSRADEPAPPLPALVLMAVGLVVATTTAASLRRG